MVGGDSQTDFRKGIRGCIERLDGCPGYFRGTDGISIRDFRVSVEASAGRTGGDSRTDHCNRGSFAAPSNGQRRSAGDVWNQT